VKPEPSYADVLTMARWTLPRECLVCGRKDSLWVTRLEDIPPEHLRRRRGPRAGFYSIAIEDYVRLCHVCRWAYRGHSDRQTVEQVRSLLHEHLNDVGV
jgi:hypothetical protein